MKYLWAGIGKLIVHQQQIRNIFTWIARFGYLAFLIYGLIEWLRPGMIQERLYRRRTLLYCLFAVSIGSSVSFMIGHIWPRKRPFINHKNDPPLIPHKDNASFPSNHSMNAMAASLILISRKNYWGIPFLVWSILLGFSRVICRLHYVSDVLGGFLLGAFSASIIYHSHRAKEAATHVLWIYDGLIDSIYCWRNRW